MLYNHWSDAHANLMWSDHQVAWTDSKNVENAMPWVREEREKKRQGIWRERMLHLERRGLEINKVPKEKMMEHWKTRQMVQEIKRFEE
jgi:hypothetical protein